MKFFENYYPTATPIEAVSREAFLVNVREIAKEDPTREISILHGRDEAGQDCFAIVSASLGTDIGYGEEAVTAAEHFDSWWDVEWDDTVTECEDHPFWRWLYGLPISEAQRARILADLINEAAEADIPLEALRDGEFLKSFFEAKGFATGCDEEGNPREDEELATAIVADAYEHFERLEDVVIAIGFYDKKVRVTSRYEYIDFFLNLDPDRASEYEIEEAEDRGSGFMACESVREAYNATWRWDFDLRISFVKKIMDGDSKYTAEAEKVYSDLRALWVDKVIAGVNGKLNPEANKTGLPYDEWCDHYAACACDEVNDFSEVDIPARDAKDGKAFTVWFEAPEELA